MNPNALRELAGGGRVAGAPDVKKKSSGKRDFKKDDPSVLTSTGSGNNYTLADRYEKVKLAGSGSYGAAWIVKRSFLSINEETDLLAEGAGSKQVKEAEKQFYTKSGHRKRFIAKEILLDDGGGDVRKLIKRTERAGSEVKVLSRLRHPNIIQYVEEIQEWDRVYIVMEYASGGDLKKLIKKKKAKYERFTEQEVLNFFTQLVMGLKHIHGCALLHRDIKPANLFLTSDYRVLKIGDFGLTKQLSPENQQAQTVCGTPANYAPEICTEQPYTSKADMWAAGCLLHELMSLEHPFVGGSKEDVFKRILSGQVSDPNPNTIYSQALVNLSRDLLLQNPASRPSASDVLMNPVVTKALEQLEREELQARLDTKKKKSSSSAGTSKREKSSDGMGCRDKTAEFVENASPPSNNARVGFNTGSNNNNNIASPLRDFDDDDLISVQPGARKGHLAALVAGLGGTGGGGKKDTPSTTPNRTPPISGPNSKQNSFEGGKPPTLHTPPRTPPPPAGLTVGPSILAGNLGAKRGKSPMAHIRAEQRAADQATKDRIRGNSPGAQRRGNSPGRGSTPTTAGAGHLPNLPAPPTRSPRVSPRGAPGAGAGGQPLLSSSSDEEEEHKAHTRKFIQHELQSRATPGPPSAQPKNTSGGAASPTPPSSAGAGARSPKPAGTGRPESHSATTGAGGRTTAGGGASKVYGAIAMSRSEFDLWLTKKVSDTTKRKKIRDWISQIPTTNNNNNGSPSGSPNRGRSGVFSPGGSTRSPVVPSAQLSVHRRCEIFDKCVEELNEFYNQQVHMTLMAIVFG